MGKTNENLPKLFKQIKHTTCDVKQKKSTVGKDDYASEVLANKLNKHVGSGLIL